jgi:hypothetical protein
LEDEVALVQPEIIAALIGVVGAILSSVISYQLGKRQSVDQDLRAQRIEVTMAIRGKMHEISTALDAIDSMHKIADYESRDRALMEFSRKIDALREYYTSNKPWLSEGARPIVGNCIADGLALMRAYGARTNARTGLWAALIPITAHNSRKRLGELDRHVSSVLGTLRHPWWRRMFGN